MLIKRVNRSSDWVAHLRAKKRHNKLVYFKIRKEKTFQFLKGKSKTK